MKKILISTAMAVLSITSAHGQTLTCLTASNKLEVSTGNPDAKVSFSTTSHGAKMYSGKFNESESSYEHLIFQLFEEGNPTGSLSIDKMAAHFPKPPCPRCSVLPDSFTYTAEITIDGEKTLLNNCTGNF